MIKTAISILLIAANAASAFAQGAAAAPTRVGIAAAVHGGVKAAAPGAIGRIVSSGKPLFLNDHVTTDAAGRLQILLNDETVFTIGPNADIVLDKFVYNPETGVGDVAAQIVRGAFRFVTGRIARRQPESMKVRLNVGVIGIRGTVVTGYTSPEGSIVINAGAGHSNDSNEPASAISVTNAGVTVDVIRTGEGVRFTRAGPPSNPVPMAAELDRISNVLGSPVTGKQASSRLLDGSASDKSGNSTSRGLIFADLDDSFNALASNASDIQNNVSQFDPGGGAIGLAYFQDFAQVPGVGNFSSTIGDYVCSGGFGACSTPSVGSMTFSMQLNFATRAVTNGGINLSGGAVVDNGTWAAFNLPASGPAVFHVGPTNFTNSNFNNSTVSFLNVNGQIAKEMVISLSYTSGSLSGATVTGGAIGYR
jgi:hypothetical protein